MPTSHVAESENRRVPVMTQIRVLDTPVGDRFLHVCKLIWRQHLVAPLLSQDLLSSSEPLLQQLDKPHSVTYYYYS